MIRHKGRPDEEERPARFPAPVDPVLFERVQSIRSERRTAHSAGGGSYGRRAYPLVRLMRCADCGSGYHGDAGNGYRRIRHSRRPTCSPTATYRAERYESQLAATLNTVTFSEDDIAQVLAVMQQASSAPIERVPEDNQEARAELQRRLAAEEMSLSAFSREWRRLERPQFQAGHAGPVDEVRLRRAVHQLRRFGDLWANSAVSGELRQEAAHELFARIEVDGPQIVALHPQPNENAWLLGSWAARTGRLSPQRVMGMVGARGIAPP